MLSRIKLLRDDAPGYSNGYACISTDGMIGVWEHEHDMAVYMVIPGMRSHTEDCCELVVCVRAIEIFTGAYIEQA